MWWTVRLASLRQVWTVLGGRGENLGVCELKLVCRMPSIVRYTRIIILYVIYVLQFRPKTLFLRKNQSNPMNRVAIAAALLLMSLCANAFTVVIDAGHGGRDAGAVGRKSKEKNINLAVALALGKMIEDNCAGVKVVYTRQKDVFVDLDERANIANRAKADLFISIHTNSTASKVGPRGAETYTLGMHRAADNLEVAKRENSVITLESNYEEKYEGFDPRSSESYIIFELMQDQNMAQSVRLAKMVQEQFRSVAGRVDKGVHQAGFLVLRATSMPSVLVELGYINNPNEETYLNSAAGIQAMAKSVYRAFEAYRK